MPNPQWQGRTVALLSVIGSCHGSQIVNTFHFHASPTLEGTLVSDTVAQTEAAALATGWITNEKPEYLACLPGDYNMVMVRCQVLERPLQWRHRLTPSEIPSAGTGAFMAGQPAEDMDSAACLRWRTARAGKQYRGRCYLGPLPANVPTNGLLSSNYITAVNTFRDAMLTAYANTTGPGSAWRLAIYSRPYNYQEYGYVKGSGSQRDWFWPQEYAGQITEVNLGAVDPVIRTQRRRQIGVGA